MSTDREKARLRGLVQRTETKAKRLIHNQVEPFRDYEWLEEICVYDEEGKLLEWYSPENQVMEQESIKHRYNYDDNGKLIEKQGFSEDDSAEDVTKYFYDDDGKMTESIYTSFQGFSKHHIFYDERGNATKVNTYDGKSDSLEFTQIWNYTYKEEGNKLEQSYFKQEGKPVAVRKSTPDKKQITIFNDAGNKVKVERYLNGWVEEAEIYDENGQRIEYKLFSGKDSLHAHYTYTYDENGNLIASHIKYGSDVRNYLYEYDEWNNLVKSTQYKDGLLEDEENHTYEYDSHKNWTKQIEIKSNKEGFQSTTEYERTINYF
jgi:YD repeat-containing protein